jgi:hypothetical protein
MVIWELKQTRMSLSHEGKLPRRVVRAKVTRIGIRFTLSLQTEISTRNLASGIIAVIRRCDVAPSHAVRRKRVLKGCSWQPITSPQHKNAVLRHPEVASPALKRHTSPFDSSNQYNTRQF